MIELREEAYDGGVATALVKALNAEINERYLVDGELAAQDDANYFAEVTPGLVTRPNGAFLVAYLDGSPAGCGALKPHDPQARIGEVKRMYTTPSARRRGVSRAVLERLEAIAVELGYVRLQLETGTAQPEAIALYEAAGWERIEPYGYYRDSPESVCFGKDARRG